MVRVAMMDYSFFILIASPAIAVVATLLVMNREEFVHPIAVVSSIVSALAATFFFYESMSLAAPAPLFDAEWIAVIGSRARFSADALSALMVWVAAFSVLVAVAAAARDLAVKRDRPISTAFHYILIFVIQIALVCFFTARDLLMLFVCYESVLIPMYLLILVWGGKERVRASIKFLLFTLFGSLPMLLAIVATAIAAWTVSGALAFDIDALKEMSLPVPVSRWLFAGFALAFLVKVPLWPLHTWLPDAHTEAPTSGSVLLAGVLLKMGGYGLMAVAVPLFPEAAHFAAPLLITLALAGILLGALASLAQADAKRLIAYSSVSHMAFVVLGVFSFTRTAWLGAAFQMAAHAVSTGCLFYFFGSLYRRRHDRNLECFGGFATLAPRLAPLAGILVFSSVALPGTAGFVAEFLVLFGAFSRNPAVAILAAPVVILSASYMLLFFRKIAYGTPEREFERAWDGEKADEFVVLFFCGALLVVAGLFPTRLVLGPLSGAVEELLKAALR